MDRAIDRTPAGRLLTTRAVKIYMDGALGSRGALLIDPYSDAPGTTGLALREHDETIELFETALEGDVQLAIHAIGDLGNKRALDWMSEAFAAYDAAHPAAEGEEEGDEIGRRWRIEHAQIVASDDQMKFSDLGIVGASRNGLSMGGPSGERHDDCRWLRCAGRSW